jgi:3-(methylthio)propanoyl-CoA dehydrogenase
MANFFEDNEDLQYYLGDGVDWGALSGLAERGYIQTDGWKNAEEARGYYREIATMVGELAAGEVAPHAAAIDREGVRFENGEVTFPARLQAIFRKLGELGVYGMTLPRELGGQNVPMLVSFVCGELLARADVSVMSHHGFHGGVAMAMLALSRLEGTTEVDPATHRIVRTRWQEEIAEIAAGRAWGSMDITEPDAGSDMAALRTRGEQDEAGHWTVSGQKIFITSGHGKFHFVVARTESAADPGAGLAGLSLFLVRAFRDEPDGRRVRLATLDRLEDKLGLHGSATLAVTFEGTPAELVGKRGEGFRLMLELMNHARLAVGFQAIGLGEAALRLARRYAADRRAMGKSLDRHEMIADWLDEMDTDLVALRALAMHAAVEEGLGHRAAARRATPLLKYLAAEKSVEMARRCLQIHGGSGYMREFAAEKLLRDAIGLPIYEGTSQIQALMATRDTLGAIIAAPRQFLERQARARWRTLSARDPVERDAARIEQLSLAAQQHLVLRTVAARVQAVKSQPLSRWAQTFRRDWNPRRDFAHASLHAERLTGLLADEAVVEVLLAQARRHPARRPPLERYLERALPRARFLHDEITSTGARLLADLAGQPSE